MNIKRILFPLILMLISLVALVGCDDDSTLTPQPLPLTAEFETLVRVQDSLFAGDTVLLNYAGQKDIIFKAKQNYDSVSWKIGNDDRAFTEKSFSLRFDKADRGKLDIIFTSYDLDRRTNEVIDTESSSKTIHILEEKDIGYAFEGTFLGHSVLNPSNLFEVTIVDFGPFKNDFEPFWLHIHNLPEGCGRNEGISAEYRLPSIREASYRGFFVYEIANSVSNCKEIVGYGKLIGQDTLEISYLFRDIGSTDRIRDKFIGVRVDK